MANAAQLKDAQKLQAPADKLLAVFEQDMARYPAQEQARKWDALEQYVSRVSADIPSKRRGLRATLQNLLRSLVGATHR